jgi:hypothetical protein
MLALAILRGYGWDVLPVHMKGSASKAAGGLALLAMIWLAHSLVRPSLVVAVAASVWSVGELQVIIGSIWYMLDPWEVPEGASILSAKAGLNLGSAGLVLIAWATWWVWKRHGQSDR